MTSTWWRRSRHHRRRRRRPRPAARPHPADLQPHRRPQMKYHTFYSLPDVIPFVVRLTMMVATQFVVGKFLQDEDSRGGQSMNTDQEPVIVIDVCPEPRKKKSTSTKEPPPTLPTNVCYPASGSRPPLTTLHVSTDCGSARTKLRLPIMSIPMVHALEYTRWRSASVVSSATTGTTLMPMTKLSLMAPPVYCMPEVYVTTWFTTGGRSASSTAKQSHPNARTSLGNCSDLRGSE